MSNKDTTLADGIVERRVRGFLGAGQVRVPKTWQEDEVLVVRNPEHELYELQDDIENALADWEYLNAEERQGTLVHLASRLDRLTESLDSHCDR